MNLDLQRDILEKRNRRCLTLGFVFLAVLTYVVLDPNSIIAIAVLCIPGWLFYHFYSDNAVFAGAVSPNLVIYLFVTGFSSVAILALCCQYTVLAVLSNALWGISVSDFVALSDEVGTLRAVLQLSGKQSLIVALLIVGFIAFGVAAVSEEVSKYVGYSWTSIVRTMTKSKQTTDDSNDDVQGRSRTRSRSRSRSRSSSGSSVGTLDGTAGIGGSSDGSVSTRFNLKKSVGRLRRRRRGGESKSPYEVVLTMLVIGLGFATMEGLNAVCSSSLPMMDRARMALWRTLLATTIHLTCCILTGIGIVKNSIFSDSHRTHSNLPNGGGFFSRAMGGWLRGSSMWRIVLPAVLIHGLYDLVTFVVSHYIPMGSWSSKQGMQWILLYGTCVACAAFFAVRAAAASVPFRQLHENPDWEGLPIHRISMADDDAGGWRRTYKRRGPGDFYRAAVGGSSASGFRRRNRFSHRYLV